MTKSILFISCAFFIGHIAKASDTITAPYSPGKQAAWQDTLVASTRVDTNKYVDSSAFADTISKNYLATIRKDTIRLVAVGDIMTGTDFPSARYLPPGNDCHNLFLPVKYYLTAADITFGNLEGVYASRYAKAKNCKDTSNCYVFRMPESHVACIKEAGFTLLSTANNHVGDFGEEGRQRTQEALAANGINFAGFSTRPFVVFEQGGLKIGFLCLFSERGTLHMNDYAMVKQVVSMLNDSCDIVIVSVHAGAEGKDYEHVTREREMFLGMDRGNIYQFAHLAIDHGADVVLGHGPHVTRAMEVYKNRIIAYSLGNFCTYARFNLSGPNGLAPILSMNLSPAGEFLSGQIIPVYQHGEGGPKIDEANRVIKRVRELSASDIPNNKLEISADGKLSIKTY
ncbi:MAG: CapA family protein [Bacteroidales bacterium]|nr:CapA family protein [Bacteroidales bacterium]